jgi:RHS repeat-associated protein
LDLSGSLEGAGGIGGLLSMTLNFEPGTLNSNSSFYHSDGNGNVTMLINPSQYIVAKYLYDAFRNILSKSGLLADANLYRFSSKEAHPNSALVYYLYRYYDPNLQRWPNRDPLGEPGFELIRGNRAKLLGDGPNFYLFAPNGPILRPDAVGLIRVGITLNICTIVGGANCYTTCIYIVLTDIPPTVTTYTSPPCSGFLDCIACNILACLSGGRPITTLTPWAPD